MAERVLLSPAKVNLFFRVVKRRLDGYHDIASLFQAVDLCDEIVLKKASKDRFSAEGREVPLGQENLCVRALELFRQKSGIKDPLHIHLLKKIPLESGLGGGSSNGATVLWGANALLGAPLTAAELRALAAQLGSDVPFFFSSGTAYCTSRGEKIEECSPPLLKQLWIATPSFGLKTAAVYQQCRPSALPDPRQMLGQWVEGNPAYGNDLEGPALELEPRLMGFRAKLQGLGFSSIALTGSGSAFFCLGDVAQPELAGVEFFKVRPLTRTPGAWYTL